MRRSPSAEKLQLHSGLVQHLISVITPRPGTTPATEPSLHHPLDQLSPQEGRNAAKACRQYWQATAAEPSELRFNAITLQVGQSVPSMTSELYAAYTESQAIACECSC